MTPTAMRKRPKSCPSRPKDWPEFLPYPTLYNGDPVIIDIDDQMYSLMSFEWTANDVKLIHEWMTRLAIAAGMKNMGA